MGSSARWNRSTRGGGSTSVEHARRSYITTGSTIAKSVDDRLYRTWRSRATWIDPMVLIEYDHEEQQIRPWAPGRKNWLLAIWRAAIFMGLIQLAKLNGHDPYHHLEDVLQRLPTLRAYHAHILGKSSLRRSLETHQASAHLAKDTCQGAAMVALLSRKKAHLEPWMRRRESHVRRFDWTATVLASAPQLRIRRLHFNVPKECNLAIAEYS